ncbi:DUF4367 domain-containing protein [Salimicrobium halophilum]|uniref:DUF4367 domain-containing protein n=1 Tax=Salimicrobium halophilum TaxID=86666 RepID=A0A1G8R8M2_9BACI|nr:DUF4367 domain-containing protein [Salimicrobium halophilum]SDJ13317.1 protein of unknown function [Salimicrobium halophilum]
MKAKSIVIVLHVILLFLYGCSAGANDNMYEVSREDVTQNLEGIEFDYELPSEMPFEIANVDVSRPSLSQPLFAVDYIGENEKHISLEVTNSDVTWTLPDETEEVDVNGNEGMFMENDQGAKILAWKAQGVSYELSTNTDIGKDMLINVAESFD